MKMKYKNKWPKKKERKKKTCHRNEMGFPSQYCTCIHRQVQRLHWTGIWECGKANTQSDSYVDPHIAVHTHTKMLFSVVSNYWISHFFSFLLFVCSVLSWNHTIILHIWGIKPISSFILAPSHFFFSLWMWSCGRWGFRCALLISQIIAIHHLFILSFRKWGHFHYCDIISCRATKAIANFSFVFASLSHPALQFLSLHGFS